MTVDAHVHAWPVWPYEPAVPDPATRGSVEQLLFELDRNDVERAVVVGARIGPNESNNRYLAEAQSRFPDRLRVLPDIGSYWSWADGGTFLDQLSSARDLATVPGFSLYLDPAGDGSCLSEARYRALFDFAGAERLVCSMGVRPHQIPAVMALAGACPSVPIVLHHFGGVTTRLDQSLAAQWAVVAPAATLSNVFLKVSGLPYLASGPRADSFEAASWLLPAAVAAFGVERLLWGSNFPVIDGSITYRQSLELVRSALRSNADADPVAVLGGNAERLLFS